MSTTKANEPRLYHVELTVSLVVLAHSQEDAIQTGIGNIRGEADDASGHAFAIESETDLPAGWSIHALPYGGVRESIGAHLESITE